MAVRLGLSAQSCDEQRVNSSQTFSPRQGHDNATKLTTTDLLLLEAATPVDTDSRLFSPRTHRAVIGPCMSHGILAAP